MKINYLFSRVDRVNGFNDNQKKYLKEDMNNNMSITFIASLFDEYDVNDTQVKEIVKIFNDIDIIFSNVYLIDNRINKENMDRYIKDSSYIYLMGGNPEKEMEFIKEYNLFDILREKDFIIGVSAGSMNQASRVIYKDDFNNYQLVDYDGFGFINLSLYPHFDINNKEYMDEVYDVSRYVRIVGLPNESFIRIKDNNIEFVGEHYFIENGKLENIK